MVLEDPTEDRRPPGAVLRNFLILALAGLFFSAAVWLSQRAPANVATLPDPQRAALYTRTLQTLGEVCTPRAITGPGSSIPSGLESFCHQQAALALDLPDCDDACRALALPLLPQPSR